ncbi:LOB domain-containing protein 2 [Beta vulgaris subsp. vulgaris]|uniref:LOB domain-containing protein 2 n=1 Tax=Beta vulgaris subsp. vulgaris TaxID=3555 RepID=UPI002036BE3F|nr:LOB domain-containing protein 2 [Beta vulgaris subsp. vulgaris]
MHRTNGISGTHQACAACKHQRKRCTDKCILAPFFPAEKVREFQAVHKVFGVSNVQKLVRNLLNDEDRKRATDSLVWEALCRQKDPILGPYGEYRKIYDELKSYQTQAQAQVHHQAGQYMAQNGHNNGSVYKSGNGLLGWSVNTNGSGGINNKVNYSGGISDNVALVDCIRAQCGPVIGSGLYGNCGSQDDLNGAEKMRQDIDASVGSVVPPQQHLMNGFSQHYYLPGEYMFNMFDGDRLEKFRNSIH